MEAKKESAVDRSMKIKNITPGGTTDTTSQLDMSENAIPLPRRALSTKTDDEKTPIASSVPLSVSQHTVVTYGEKTSLDE
mmetsp:Transcript_15457/g.20761  ORF Transcript_15457/g.20761 Transcript_15457/m.20761 type:complete len:80 (-) Transcript_15457:343-582(-)|eukprot:CAMPEP_0185798422 /NCGR_PEP_ID=MMETSP1174-20130828/162144_1 /TAXON_ID=35687 /ORGANISM="Dictyocha speculum, Strain CCMP1381" /LENGTH=79 /DNA_ID=CAMNT_0028493923 /DNA_START=151 /DNA_END=390 /DNA_ORIENTATION=+